LLRWFQSVVAAWFAATLFVFNGYIASRFSRGHVIFAFFSLIPIIIDAFESAYGDRLGGKARFSNHLVLIAATWLLFTAGLPPPLFYFYPAFILFVLARVLRDWRRQESNLPVKAAAQTLAFHLAGFLLAAYKFVPIVQYQYENPRGGVVLERMSFGTILENFIRFSERYGASAQAIFEGQKWGLWEYNAYIGLLPLLFAVGAVVVAARWVRKREFEFFYLGFAIILIVAGALLALGNDGWGPAALFRHLPLIEGIRVFARYQILTIFGMIILGAYFLAALERIFPPRLKRAVWLCAILGVAPGIYQSYILVKDVRAVSESALDDQFAFPAVAVPALANQAMPAEGTIMESHLLRKGYWVANCYEPLSVPNIGWEGRTLALSAPVAPKDVKLGSNYFELRYESAMLGQNDLRLNYPVTSYLSFEPQPFKIESGFAWFHGADVAQLGKLKVEANTSATTTGLVISCLGLVMSAGLFYRLAMTSKR
jgi:hypothetical protein